MPLLELQSVSKSYPGHPVLTDINLSIPRGEFVAIVGYSGTGKTTLINLLAGLTSLDSGALTFDGAPVTGPSPERGLVFQNYSLLPWLTVSENVRLAVDTVHTDLSRTQKARLVEKFVCMVNLAKAAHKRPHELSGGMRQRVSVARTLAMDPEVLLMDEPLSALDALTRATIQDEIAQIWARDRKTVVLITNDVDEGLLLADRIIPLLPTPGGATLGEPVLVDLPRPRDRKAVNHDPAFQHLRREVFSRLRAVSPSKRKEPVHGAA